MIPSWLKSLSKSEWWKRREQQLQQEFALQEQALLKTFGDRKADLERAIRSVAQEQEVVKRQESDCESVQQRLTDRHIELQRAQEEVKLQLRLTEAKASPDSVWVRAFSTGYEKAWESMWPVMAEGIQKVKQSIEQQAIDATLQRLEETVIQRAEDLGQTNARSLSDLRSKRAEFLHKRTQAQEQHDRQAISKYEYYLEAIDWMLHADGLHPNQSPTE